jgi:hypothetical protein
MQHAAILAWVVTLAIPVLMVLMVTDKQIEHHRSHKRED